VILKIVLDRDEAQCLVNHADKSTVAWAIMEGSITRWIVSGIPAPAVTVECTEEAAHDLLSIAEKHCHSTVGKILEAIRSHNPKP
jgi:hypothetical protein